MNRVKIVLSIVVLSLFFMIVVNYPNTITLELGVFSGSNWGVPSGESYKIIDGAIEPNVLKSSSRTIKTSGSFPLTILSESHEE